MHKQKRKLRTIADIRGARKARDAERKARDALLCPLLARFVKSKGLRKVFTCEAIRQTMRRHNLPLKKLYPYFHRYPPDQTGLLHRYLTDFRLLPPYTYEDLSEEDRARFAKESREGKWVAPPPSLRDPIDNTFIRTGPTPIFCQIVSAHKGLLLICQKCMNRVEVFGTTDRSERYGFVQMRKTCPNRENNRYERLDGNGD